MELVTNGKTLLFINRPAAYSGRRKGLGPNQLRWCADNLTGFAWPRVQRLADEKATAAMRSV